MCAIEEGEEGSVVHMPRRDGEELAGGNVGVEGEKSGRRGAGGTRAILVKQFPGSDVERVYVSLRDEPGELNKAERMRKRGLEF